MADSDGVRIASYGVVVGVGNKPTRQLNLEAPEAQTFKHIAMYFGDKPGEAARGGSPVGYAKASDGFVVVYLSTRDFDDMYNLLRNEAGRVTALWAAEPGGNLDWFQLETAAS